MNRDAPKIHSTFRKPFANGRKLSTTDCIELENSDDEVRFLPKENGDPIDRFDDASLRDVSNSSYDQGSVASFATHQRDQIRAISSVSSTEGRNISEQSVMSGDALISVAGSSRREVGTQEITIDDSDDDDITILDEVPAAASSRTNTMPTLTGQTVTLSVKSEFLQQNVSQTQTADQRLASLPQIETPWHRLEVASPDRTKGSGCSPPRGQVPFMVVEDGHRREEVEIDERNLPTAPDAFRRLPMVQIFDEANINGFSPVADRNELSVRNDISQQPLSSSASSFQHRPVFPSPDPSDEMEFENNIENTESHSASSENVDVRSQIGLLRQELRSRQPAQSLNEKPRSEAQKVEKPLPQISLPGTPKSPEPASHDDSVSKLDLFECHNSVSNHLQNQEEEIANQIQEEIRKMASEESKFGNVARTWGVSTSMKPSSKSEKSPTKKIIPFGKDRNVRKNVGEASKNKKMDSADKLFTIDPQEKCSKIIRNVEKMSESSKRIENVEERMDTSTQPILLLDLLGEMHVEKPEKRLESKSSNKNVVEQGETSRKESNVRRRSSSGKGRPKTADRRPSVTLDNKLVDKCLSALVRQKLNIRTPNFDNRRESKMDKKFLDKE